MSFKGLIFSTVTFFVLFGLCGQVFADAPSNDDFAYARPIIGKTGTAIGTNVQATKQPGEPNHAGVKGGVSVWWSWTAKTSGTVTFETTGSLFNTVLAVYTGSAVDSLSEVASNDDGENNTPQSELKFDADINKTYYIVVDGAGGATGGITLKWDLVSNDNLIHAEAITAGPDPNTVYGTNEGASDQDGEPDHAGVAGGVSVWFKWESPATGDAVIDTHGSSFDTLLAVYTCSVDEPNEMTDLVLPAVEENDDDPNRTDGSSFVKCPVTGGVVYYIAVDGAGGAVGEIVLNTLVEYNDNFEDADELPGASGSVADGANNNFATKQVEAGEPDHAGNPGGRSVWWKWTALVDGKFFLDATASSPKPLLAVYTGTNLADLQEVSSSADGMITTDVIAGTQYYIAVDGPDGDKLDIKMDYSGRFNDVFADAYLVVDKDGSDDYVEGSDNGTNVGASLDTNEPVHETFVGHATVWWKWKATFGSPNNMMFNTFGSDLEDTVMAVYEYTGTGTPDFSDPSKVNKIVSNDDYDFDNGILQSLVIFTPTVGTTYYIVVDAWYNEEGEITLNWSSRYNDNLNDAIRLTDQTGTAKGSNFDMTKEEGEPAHAGNKGGSSVWWYWIPDYNGKVTFDTYGSDCNTLLAIYEGTSAPPVEYSSLTLKADNDNSDDPEITDGTSRIAELDVTSGSVYYIAVDGAFDGTYPDTGDIVLNWNYFTNDKFENAYLLEGDSGSASGDNAHASGETADEHAGFAANADLWWYWIAPGTGAVTFDTYDSAPIDTVISAYYYDEHDILTQITQDPNDYRDRAPDQSDPNAMVEQGLMSFNVTGGNTYYIVLDEKAPSRTGTISMKWSMIFNDYFADAFSNSAFLLRGGKGTVSSVNTGATAEEGEPAHNDNGPSHSVWWKWGAPLDTTVTFTVNGIPSDIAVYTGEAVDNLTEVAAGSGTVDFETTADTAYFIAIDGGEGAYTLSWRQSYNNDIEDAIEIVMDSDNNSGGEEGNNEAADTEDNEDFHGRFGANATLWWKWTSPANCNMVFDSSTSSIDTYVAVYTYDGDKEYPSVEDLTFVDADVDGVEFKTDGNIKYYIVVDGLYGAKGDIKLDWEFTVYTAETPYVVFPEYILADSTLSGTKSGFNNSYNEPIDGFTIHDEDTYHPVAALWVPPTSGRGIVNTYGSGIPTKLAVYHIYKTGYLNGSFVVDIDQDLSDENLMGDSLYGGDVWFNIVGGDWYLIIMDSRNENSYGGININYTLETNDNLDHAFDLTYDDDHIADRDKYIKISYGPDDELLAGWTKGFNNLSYFEGDESPNRQPEWRATAQINEPNHLSTQDPNSTLWFEWKTAMDSRVLFYAQQIQGNGTENPAVIGVYESPYSWFYPFAPDMTELIPVASNLPASGYDSIEFDAAAYTKYYIAIDGYQGQNGDLELVWLHSINDDLADAYDIDSSGYVDRLQSVSGDVYHTDTSYTNFAFDESGEPGDPYHSVWWNWQSYVSGIAVFETFGSNFNTTLAAYLDPEGHYEYYYDNSNGYWIYYSDYVCNYENFELMAENDDANDFTVQSEIHFDVEAGNTYNITVDGHWDTSAGFATLNWYTITNDDFLNAKALAGIGGTVKGFNNYTTLEPLEPVHAGVSNDSSVWWVWTPSVTGSVVIDTSGSDFDTVLGVYTGVNVRHLTEIASNDNISASDPNSSVSFFADADTSYYIAVAGKTTASVADTGLVVLHYDMIEYKTLTITGTGSGSVDINGTAYTLPYSEVLPVNSVLNVTAVPDVSNRFVEWAVNLPEGLVLVDPYSADQTVVLYDAVGLTANFENWIDMEEFAAVSEVWDANGFDSVYVPDETAYWKLDDPNTVDPNVVPAEPDTYDGVLKGVLGTYSSDAVFGQSLLLTSDPNDHVQTPFVINPASGSFSAFAWVRGTGTGLEPDQTILSQGNGQNPTGAGKRWLYNNIQSEFGLTTGLITEDGSPLVSGVDIIDGQWHHVGVVVAQDESQFRRILYVDGIAVAWDDPSGLSGTLESTNGLMFIGADKTLARSRCWQGNIDDVRIYDQALTPEQVSGVMAGLDGPVTGIACVRRYEMDINGDCLVNLEDIVIFAEDWLTLQ